MNMKAKIFTTLTAASVVAGHGYAKEQPNSTPEQVKDPVTQIAENPSKDFTYDIKGGYTFGFNNNTYSVCKYTSGDRYFYTLEDSDKNHVSTPEIVDAAIKKATLIRINDAKDNTPADQRLPQFELETVMDGKTQTPVVDEKGNKVRIDPNSVDRIHGKVTMEKVPTISLMTAAKGMGLTK